MKSLLAGLLLLGFVSNASAALIDNGIYTTDDISGLDWLDLTETSGLSYNNALTGLDPTEGWRYATNVEVENLFGILFQGFYSNTSDDASDSRYSGAYADHRIDTNNFFSLFGTTRTGVNDITYGLYVDEDGLLRNMGAWQDIYSRNGAIYGTEFSPTYDADLVYSNYYGSYIVRDPASVSEASSIYLLAFGLFGLLIAARQKI